MARLRKSLREMCEIFLNSLDNSNGWKIVNVKTYNDIDINAVATSADDDGTPVLKLFDRGPIRTSYSFDAGKEYSMVLSDYSGCYYLFTNNLWYRFEGNEIEDEFEII